MKSFLIKVFSLNFLEKVKCILNSYMTGLLSYRNQSIDLLCKSMDWFLYDNGLRHERVKVCRSSRPEVFCKNGVLRNFIKLTGKQLCQSLRPAALLEISKNTVSAASRFGK